MIIIFYLLLLLVLGVYSYSQIDLNLTLLQSSWFLNFQNQMIQLGYFNRLLSTYIFIVITLLLFIFYIYFVLKAEKISLKTLVMGLLGIGILGLLSYPAFSHDIFNYIFDARIAVFHGANPYTSTALMFPLDTWTRFMNWTHRSYPYGPTFLPISILFYFLGLNKFIWTLVLFKSMLVGSFLGTSYLIYKLAGKKALAIFAFNPLVIYEMVVSSHLDGLMLFFAILGYFLYVKKKKFAGITSWIISVGIKYATIFNFPGLPLSWLIILSYAGAIAQIFSRELLPHYFLVPLAFTALLPANKKLFWLGFILSLILIFIRYTPYLYTGQWPRLLN